MCQALLLISTTNTGKIMEINLISYSFTHGGAALAAKRFANLISNDHKVNLIEADSSPEARSRDRRMHYKFFKHLFKRIVSYFLVRLMYSKNPIKHSLNLFSSPNIVSLINKSNHKAICNIHWFNNDSLSVFKIKSIPYASVVTLHDEWLYCGAEHCYDIHDQHEKFINGYKFFDSSIIGFNWNYLIWKVKLILLASRDDIIFTVPSYWMLDRAKKSKILNGKDVRLLPNPVDVLEFYPLSENQAKKEKERIGIANDDIVICIGSFNDSSNQLKGARQADESLKVLAATLPLEILNRVCVITFGSGAGQDFIHGFRVVNIGYVHGSKEMRALYSVADCSIVPSLVESFGQVAAESLACGVPVIAFDCSGLKDLVVNGVNGYTALPYNSIDLADCICRYLLESDDKKNNMKVAAHKHIVDNFSSDVIREKYIKILNESYSKLMS